MTDQHLTVEQVDPRTLLVYLNVRSDAALDKDFLASVRDLGVLVPIVAVRTENGALRVRYGHRRALAAVEVGRATVPVIVTGADGADEAARIVTQWHEHRAGLSTADKVAAVEQLSLLGLSAAQIVKQTRARKADVEQALATAGSALAKGAATRYEFLTLDQAAAVAEFSEPETVKALIASARASDGDFAHARQRARDEREAAAQVAALQAELAEANVRVIERPSYDERRGTKALEELVTDKGKQISPASHASCPGHAAYIANEARRPDRLRLYAVGPGRARRAVQQRRPVRVRADDRGREGTAPRGHREQQGVEVERDRPPRVAQTLPHHPQVRAQGRLRLPRRRTCPRHPRAAPRHGAQPPARRHLARLDHATGRDVLAAATGGATDARAVVIALGVVLGDIEESTGPHSWRNPSDTVRRYFTFLAENGYALSDVENLAASGPASKRGRGPAAPGNATAAA